MNIFYLNKLGELLEVAGSVLIASELLGFKVVFFIQTAMRKGLNALQEPSIIAVHLGGRLVSIALLLFYWVAFLGSMQIATIYTITNRSPFLRWVVLLVFIVLLLILRKKELLVVGILKDAGLCCSYFLVQSIQRILGIPLKICLIIAKKRKKPEHAPALLGVMIYLTGSLIQFFAVAWPQIIFP